MAEDSRWNWWLAIPVFRVLFSIIWGLAGANTLTENPGKHAHESEPSLLKGRETRGQYSTPYSRVWVLLKEYQ